MIQSKLNKKMNEVIKWINIAKSDIKSSKILLENGCYSQSYFYFQQASEKANKAYWLFDGTLDESQLKKIGHNQFKPLRKNLVSEKDKIDYLKAFEAKTDMLFNSPLLENIDIDEYESRLNESLKFIDRFKKQSSFDFKEEELFGILKNLEELKEIKIDIPENFSDIFKQKLKEQIAWLKKFKTQEADEQADLTSEIVNDQNKFKDQLGLVKDLVDKIGVLLYISSTLTFCSILTVQHSNSTRYPQELNGQSPIDVYTNDLAIIKNQLAFLEHLEKALDRLSVISINYKPIENDKIKEITEKTKPFLIPDSRWKIFKVKSESDFHREFLVSKNTHSDVPDHIVEELISFEKLQLLSYYYYPLYGDSFSRLTRIFEMAIKAKAKQLNIEISISGRDVSLNKLIVKVCTDYSGLYKRRMDWARRMRNMNAHPENTTLYGNILKTPLIRLTNIVNDVFRTKEFFENEDKVFKKMKSDYKVFEAGLWKLDQYLIHSVEVFAVRNDLSLWGFYPVLLNYPSKEEDNLFIIEPFFSIIKHHKIVNDSLILETIDNLKIEINSTIKKENIDRLKNYQNQIDLASEDTKKSVDLIMEQIIGYQIENFKYLISTY